ncbi:MAG: arginine--tRNA ligase, partial [Saprospiraceae bacterium]|nr:arginine--tRNA ligase [Saprospiraceae bacterium]
MDIFTLLQQRTAGIIQSEFNYQIAQDDILIQPTRKEFDGEYTIVTFPLAGPLRQAPPAIAAALGEALVREEPLVKGYNVVKGFLNLSLSDTYWHRALGAVTSAIDTPGRAGQKVLVEFASPNTNKPLHLGHVRNILLGWSMSRIFETLGHQVVRVQIINDRGIAICKSMLAWQMWADGATPASTGTKPDHFVGEWYVRFEREFQDEYQQWQKSETARDLLAASAQKDDPGAFFKQYKNTYFNEISPLGIAAREMLRKWEAGDQEVRALWQQMNQWVYQGFESTYQRLGVRFDKLYYESETYLLGKDLVEQGLARGIFYQKEDGSVWVDLEDAGLDHKILLRSDGTSVYITQDLGTAQLRYEDFGTDRMIYVVADEQNYHFKALFETLKLLGTPYANGLHHLAYGMVDLPTGRMKTREGTVVDADDLMDEVLEEARLAAAERGEISELSNEEQEDILHRISLAALKYFIIRV